MPDVFTHSSLGQAADHLLRGRSQPFLQRPPCPLLVSGQLRQWEQSPLCLKVTQQFSSKCSSSVLQHLLSLSTLETPLLFYFIGSLISQIHLSRCLDYFLYHHPCSLIRLHFVQLLSVHQVLFRDSWIKSSSELEINIFFPVRKLFSW